MRMQIPATSMVYGSPAKVIRPLTDKELIEVHDSARRYQKLQRSTSDRFRNFWDQHIGKRELAVTTRTHPSGAKRAIPP
jgi:hypothetical protein